MSDWTPFGRGDGPWSQPSAERDGFRSCTASHAPETTHWHPLRTERATQAEAGLDHNEQEEPFSPVHCHTGDTCHEAIAREYAAFATTPKEPVT